MEKELNSSPIPRPDYGMKVVFETQYAKEWAEKRGLNGRSNVISMTNAHTSHLKETCHIATNLATTCDELRTRHIS